MPNIPVRDLAKGGILRDIHPTSAPLPAWSNGRNVCFESGKVLRSPIWRTVMDGLGTDAKFCAALTPASGMERVCVARDDGSLAIYANGSISSANEAGFVAGTAGYAPWSACFLGDVLYVNRMDRAPRVLLPTATQFTLDPQWDTSWRCRVIRQFNDGIVALNVTKGATATPSMVKVSDITFYGTTPRSWDSTDPTKLAYENPLAQLDGPILDGLTLGDRFMFYTAHQAWEMRAGGSLDYTFRKAFGDDGVIGTNCIAEVDGVHYVFGARDIYVTDGQTKKSIAEGRVREWVYRTMNIQYADKFFAQFLPKTNEVMFGFVSGDASCAWRAPTGCNNAAVYNITTNTWSFADLPNVSAMTLCNVAPVLTYATVAPRTFNGMGGSYYDLEDNRELHTVAIAAPLNTPGSTSVIGGTGLLLGYDFIDRGQLTFEANLACCAPSFVERTGIALDDPSSGSAPLNVDKEVQAIYPEVTISRAVSVQVQLGSQMTTSGPVTWEDPQPYDPTTDYKVDSRASGRFLAVRFMFDPMADTEVSGFDVQVISNGSR